MTVAPTFAVIGAQRGGTTTLFEYLRHHPDIFIPPLKELNFFIDGPEWRRGRSWYDEQFAGAGAARHLGDVSPAYTMFPVATGAAERLAAHAPDARLIYLVRHPIERMLSGYRLLRAYGLEQQPLDDALRKDTRYLAASLYDLQLERYRRRFPAEQILVVVSEDLYRDPDPVLDRVLAHLGLDPGWRPPGLGAVHNAGRERRREPRPGALVALRVAQRRGLRRWQGQDLVRWPATSRPIRTVTDPRPETLDALLELLVPDLARFVAKEGWATDPWGLLEATRSV